LTRNFAPAKCQFGASAFLVRIDLCTLTKWCGSDRVEFLASQRENPACSAGREALDSVAIRAAPVFDIDPHVRRERPRGRARGQVRAPRAGSLTPLPHCDTGNRALTGRQKAPPACLSGHRPKALLLMQLKAAYRRLVIPRDGGSPVTTAEPEGANRAFG